MALGADGGPHRLPAATAGRLHAGAERPPAARQLHLQADGGGLRPREELHDGQHHRVEPHRLPARG